jgi:single-strand DNA-binding protein
LKLSSTKENRLINNQNARSDRLAGLVLLAAVAAILSSLFGWSVLGHLGKDPEMRYTPSGSAICNLRIATTRNWKNKESGERVEETEWHSVVLYDRIAEVAGEYLKKGRQVYIEGRLKTTKWQDKAGADRYTTQIVGESLQLLGGTGDADGAQNRQPRQGSVSHPPAPRQNTSAPTQS